MVSELEDCNGNLEIYPGRDAAKWRFSIGDKVAVFWGDHFSFETARSFYMSRPRKYPFLWTRCHIDSMMAQLYDVDVRAINEHISHIFNDGELDQGATVRNFRIVQIEGSRNVSREVMHYITNEAHDDLTLHKDHRKTVT